MPIREMKDIRSRIRVSLKAAPFNDESNQKLGRYADEFRFAFKSAYQGDPTMYSLLQQYLECILSGIDSWDISDIVLQLATSLSNLPPGAIAITITHNTIVLLEEMRKQLKQVPEDVVQLFLYRVMYTNSMVIDALTRAKLNELDKLCSTDSLTSCLNRRELDRVVARELKSSQRHGHDLTLVMIDLDRFKDLNDTYGHLAGDTVLRWFGLCLQNSIRIGDHAGRFGGEEFLLVLPYTDGAQAIVLCQRLRHRLEAKHFSFSGKNVQVRCSLGVAEVNVDDTEITAVNRADEALYLAKASGRNAIGFQGSVIR